MEMVEAGFGCVSSLWRTRWWIWIGWHVSLESSVENGLPVKITRKSDAWSGSLNLSRTMDRFGVVASLSVSLLLPYRRK
jgi:hypothetical protein